LCVWYKRRVRTSRSRAGNRRIRRRPRHVPWKCVQHVCALTRIRVLVVRWRNIVLAIKAGDFLKNERAFQCLQDKSLMDYPVSFFVHSTTDTILFERHFNIATFLRSIYRNSRLNFFLRAIYLTPNFGFHTIFSIGAMIHPIERKYAMHTKCPAGNLIKISVLINGQASFKLQFIFGVDVNKINYWSTRANALQIFSESRKRVWKIERKISEIERSRIDLFDVRIFFFC